MKKGALFLGLILIGFLLMGFVSGSGGICTDGSTTYSSGETRPDGYTCGDDSQWHAPDSCTPPSNTQSGNHCGQNWIISANTQIAGSHTNIRNFIIKSGINVTIKPFDGTNFGSVEIHATNIVINGTIDASGAGYGGGGGGASGTGCTGRGNDCGMTGLTRGTGGSGTRGGANGAHGIPSSAPYGERAGPGGAGGGSFGGVAGVSTVALDSLLQTNIYDGGNGGNGGYRITGGQGDTSTDGSLFMGSGGAGGAGGGAQYGHTSWCVGGAGGGAAGNPGGGMIKLYASNLIETRGEILAKGLLGTTGNGANGVSVSGNSDTQGSGVNGGSASSSGSSVGGIGTTATCACRNVDQSCGNVKAGNGGSGGAGAGGGILLSAPRILLNGTINNLGGGNNAANGGTVKLLCSSAGLITQVPVSGRNYITPQCSIYYTLNQTYWANLNGNSITSSNIKDTVLLMVPGENLDTQVINYTIIKDGAINTWNPLNWFDHTVLKTSSLGISDWKIFDSGTFRFIGVVGGISNQSNNLAVANSEIDSSPIALITSPSSGYKTSVNYSIDFTHSSSDEDDLLRLTWDFADGKTEVFNNYSLALTPNLGNTNHNYTSAGTYQIKLTASEPGRTNPKSSSDYKTIYVLQPGINVITIISSPNASTSYGNWVIFNASTSFVANCTRGPMAGANFVAGDLNCSYIHEPLKKAITESYDLKLNWSVYYSNGRMEQGFPRSASWKNNYSYIVDYPIYFEDAKTRNAVLSITYTG
jgi:hypothetical protein